MYFRLLFLFFLASAGVSAQTLQWRLLTGSPGTIGIGRFEDMYFINATTGWIINYSGQVYRTTNGGQSWTNIFTSTFGTELRSTGFFNSTTGLIGTLIEDTNKVLYRTTDGGSSWTAVTNFSGGKRPDGVCGMSIVNEDIAYACGRYFGSARVIKTSDRGSTWKLVFNDTSLARTLIDCYFWTPDSGIAVGGSLPQLNGNAVVIKTTNGGTTWQRVYKTSRNSEWCWKISFISRQTGFVSIERGSGMAYFLKTTNNGNNWTEIPFRVYDEEGIGFVNENTGWIGGWTGPTYQTTDGGANWSLAGWGTNVNRFRFLSDTLAYCVGDRVYKYSRGIVPVTEISENVPDRFRLYQNYPNPFNPVTKIRFDITPYDRRQTSIVKLLLIDLTGKELKTLVNEYLSPGSYEVEFDGSNYPGGVYFYKLVSKDFKEVKKLLLLK